LELESVLLVNRGQRDARMHIDEDFALRRSVRIGADLTVPPVIVSSGIAALGV
jgi:hypothetical protein